LGQNHAGGNAQGRRTGKLPLGTPHTEKSRKDEGKNRCLHALQNRETTTEFAQTDAQNNKRQRMQFNPIETNNGNKQQQNAHTETSANEPSRALSRVDATHTCQPAYAGMMARRGRPSARGNAAKKKK
jgi:hypothetical protein